MKTRVLVIALISALLLSGTASALAAVNESDSVGAEGITRGEAAILLAMLLGERPPEGIVLTRAQDWLDYESYLNTVYVTERPIKPRYHPFNDVPEEYSWAVGYLYENKITFGYPDGKFHSEYACETEMYVVLLLRALGYADTVGDFEYADIMNGGDSAAWDNMPGVRGELGINIEADSALNQLKLISLHALLTKTKAAERNLVEKRGVAE
jgi:hypothetical protein